MPDIPAVTQDMAEAFVDLGMAWQTGAGFAVMPYAEIAAGAPWASLRERKLIRAMSRAYLEGRKTGDDPFGIPPSAAG